MKITLIIIILLLTLSCSTTKVNSKNEIPTKSIYKTQNPNTPYIYRNGFKNFEINSILMFNENDSTYVNELKFNAVASAMYTQKLMYDKFGLWDKTIKPENEHHLILVWEKIKLFEANTELYTVAAGGIESRKEMFASVMVFDSKNRDCLSENSKVKDSLIDYFSNGIKNLNSDNKFYRLYQRTVRKNK